VRDFIHVSDLALGHLAALASLDRSGSGCHPLNLGTGTGTTVLEMVDAASAAAGHPIPYAVVDRRAGDACSVTADPARANEVLGWHAERTIDDMCRDHWRWQATHPYGFQDVESLAG
jgi:UDP-glucose 4-epimerase